MNFWTKSIKNYQKVSKIDKKYLFIQLCIFPRTSKINPQGHLKIFLKKGFKSQLNWHTVLLYLK